MFVKDSVPTAVEASALAEPERPIVTDVPTVVAARNSLKTLLAPSTTVNGTSPKARDMILALTSVCDGPFGINNWAKTCPSAATFMSCCKATMSIGKSNGMVNVAVVELLEVAGAYAVSSENWRSSSFRFMDWMIFRTPRLGRLVSTWSAVMASFNHETYEGQVRIKDSKIKDDFHIGRASAGSINHQLAIQSMNKIIEDLRNGSKTLR